MPTGSNRNVGIIIIIINTIILSSSSIVRLRGNHLLLGHHRSQQHLDEGDRKSMEVGRCSGGMA